MKNIDTTQNLTSTLNPRTEKLKQILSPSSALALKRAALVVELLSIILTILNQFLFTLDSTPQRSPLHLMIPLHNVSGDI